MTKPDPNMTLETFRANTRAVYREHLEACAKGQANLELILASLVAPINAAVMIAFLHNQIVCDARATLEKCALLDPNQAEGSVSLGELTISTVDPVARINQLVAAAVSAALTLNTSQKENKQNG